MLQADLNKREQLQDLKQVDKAAPAPIAEAIAADQTRTALAREYATEAIKSLDPKALTAENILDAGAALLEEKVIKRIAKLLGDTQEPDRDQTQEEFLKRAQVIGKTAKENLEGDLGGKVSTVELERLSIRASREAERTLKSNPALMDKVEEARRVQEQAESPLETQPNPPKIGLGGRVENLVLATSDYPLKEMQGPGFEMLAEKQQRPQAAFESEVNPLSELSAPRGFNRRTGTIFRASSAPAPSLEAAIDYASADLSGFSFKSPESSNSTSYKLELARDVQEEAAIVPRTRRVA